MNVKLLKATDFRGRKLKKGEIIDVPDGLANKMILNAEAVKFNGEVKTNSDVKKTLSKMNVDELIAHAKSLGYEIDGTPSKKEIIALIGDK